MAVTPALPGVNVDQLSMLRQTRGSRHSDTVSTAPDGQHPGADFVFVGPLQALGNCMRGLPESRVRAS